MVFLIHFADRPIHKQNLYSNNIILTVCFPNTFVYDTKTKQQNAV